MTAMERFFRVRNRGRIIQSFFTGSPGSPFFPREIVIELTNFCNLDCVMCPHGKMTRKKGQMETALFEKIIDEAKGGTELVYLYGTGESLLHEELAACIRYASRAGMATVLSTNGMLLTPAISEELLTSGLDFLVIALDGAFAHTYESIRVHGKFDQAMENTKALLKIKENIRSRTHLTLQMIRMEENAQEADQLKGRFTKRERRAINAFRFKPLFSTYADHGACRPPVRPCFLLWDMMAVLWDGQVALCCMDYDGFHILGDCNRRTVAEIWNREKINGIRAKHLASDYRGMRPCNTCDIPGQGYFAMPALMGAQLFSAKQARRLLPLYERLFIRK